MIQNPNKGISPLPLRSLSFPSNRPYQTICSWNITFQFLGKKTRAKTYSLGVDHKDILVIAILTILSCGNYYSPVPY